MSTRRSTRVRTKPAAAAAADSDNDDEDSSADEEEAAPSPPRRVSSRATKFKGGMKEKSDNLNDLFTSDDPLPASLVSAGSKKRGKKKGKGRSKSKGGSDDDDDDESMGEAASDEDESDAEPPKRKGGGGKRGGGGKKKAEPAAKKTPVKAKRGKGKAKQPKSPAVRHKSRRRVVKTEVQMSTDDEESAFEEEESDEESEDEEGDDDEDKLKIQRIIASRSETRRRWREICSKMNTSEIENGSRWFQEGDDEEKPGDDDTFEERFLLKWSDLGFMHLSWELEDDLIAQIENAKTYLTTFFRRSQNGLLFDADERGDGEYFDPTYVQVERILEVADDDIVEESDDDEEEEVSPKGKGKGKKTKGKGKGKGKGRGDKKGGKSDDGDEAGEGKESDDKPKKKERTTAERYGIILDKDRPDYDEGTGRQFLVKWGGTPYTEGTYEFERDLILCDIEYEEHVDAFNARSQKPPKAEMTKCLRVQEEQTRRLYKVFGDKANLKEKEKEKKVAAYQKKLEDHVFPNGGRLRDYQAEGVSWMISNYINKRSAILADEMGLGKTIQTAVLVNYLATAMSGRGPYLIVVPLSTLQHWYREFSSWTNLNTIIYHGSAKDREHLREKEFAYESDRPHNLGVNASYLRRCHKKSAPRWEKTWMVTVVITTPEMLVTDDFSELTSVKWDLLVVDEAHRLKNHASKLAVNLRDPRFAFKSTLLLTGTPIQNNMAEMWTLLNIVDPKKFDDVEDFLEQYGDIKSKDKLDELHERIRPYILRRLKEDVEKSVPPKEETLIEVELTVLQKQYYRALYEKNVGFLHRNKKKALDGPSINNLAMQLRKCCNHPFLLRGVEDEVKEQDKGATTEVDLLVKAGGKLVLLDKLLPKLRDGGHRVLIFSQFKIMLDILEDYLALRSFKSERIDGSITGKKRQMAIDRFQAKESSSFVMLLSTRAGGVGINLTAADTCIIFDSDWNPQNDLQAQARCHRIGQTKSVKVYRLLSRKSYEMQMFHMSSLKMGLDQAVLQGIEGNGGDGSEGLTKEEVEKLLRCGAYDIFSEEKAGESAKESNEFENQDIDSILERRTTNVVHKNTGSKSSAAGGTFSKASFKAAEKKEGDATAEDVDIDDPEFWTKMVGEAQVEDDKDNLDGKKRKRKKANYSEKDYERQLNATLRDGAGKYDESSSSGEEHHDESDDDDDGAASDEDTEKEKTRWGGKGKNDWRKVDAEAVLKGLMTFGYSNIPWEQLKSKLEFEKEDPYSTEETKRMGWSLSLSALREAVDDEVRDAKKRAERAAEKKREADLKNGNGGEPSSDGGVLGKATQQTPEDLEKEKALSFEKLWAMHSSWAKVAIDDALEYSKDRLPRNADVIGEALGEKTASKEKKQTQLELKFEENVWPALRTRGWKEEKNGYSYGGTTYRSVSAVLDAAPTVHKELANTIESVTNLAATANAENEAAAKAEAKKNAIDPNNVTPKALTSLLRSYAPLQLLGDRVKPTNKISLKKSFLGVLSLMSTVHSLVAKANGEEGTKEYEKIKSTQQLLATDKRVALPHSSWKPSQDAVLIRAIAKHGWIDRDRASRAIAQDNTIKWGHPFDEGYDMPAEEIPEKDVPTHEPLSYDELKAVADRAAAFMNSENNMVQELKGFNRELVVRSFSLAQRRTPDVPNPVWEVDEKMLRRVAENAGREEDTETKLGAPDQDLPSRKDLAKRAKMVLTRIAAGSQAPAQAEQAAAANGPIQASSETKHNFCVLDQSNGCNIFLSELLHAVLKVSITKGNGQRHMRRLLRYASEEAERIALLEASKSEKKETGEEGSNAEDGKTDDTKPKEDKEKEDDANDKPKEDKGDKGKDTPPSKSEEEKSALSDMRKLKENLRFVSRTIKVWNRQAKNIVRCILGMEPLKAQSGTQTLFPPENYSPLPSPKDSSAGGKHSEGKNKKAKQKQKESAAGDVAINRALATGLQKKISTNDDGSLEETLKLSSIETLILSVICSQGLPAWTEDWEALVDPQCCVESETCKGEEFVINWYRMGGVVLNAATVWQNIASKNLQSKQRCLEKNREKLSDDQVKELIHECRQLQEDLERKSAAIADAKQLRSDPHLLAKKSVMMLESLKKLMGPVDSKSAGASKKTKELGRREHGLGPRVMQWASKELNRWANCLNIVDEHGRCISSTAADYEEGVSSTAAFFNRKSCRTIFIQVAQQTRLRSIFIKNGTTDVASLMPKVLRNSRKNGDDWSKCPSWWSSSESSSKDDIDLLVGLLDYGYSGFDEMLRQNSSFRARIETVKKAQQESADGSETPLAVFTRASAQLRANHLTRELNALEDTADVMRLVSERAKMRHSSGTPEKEAGSKRSSSIQTGIDVFFKSNQGSEKKQKSSSRVSDTESVNCVEVIEVDGDESGPAEKRKSSVDDEMMVVEASNKKLKAS